MDSSLCDVLVTHCNGTGDKLTRRIQKSIWFHSFILVFYKLSHGSTAEEYHMFGGLLPSTWVHSYRILPFSLFQMEAISCKQQTCIELELESKVITFDEPLRKKEEKKSRRSKDSRKYHHPILFFCFCLQTTLAHIIASSIKKKGTGRFITLSATSASTSDVREVIKQAQNELRLCKRKTVLFIDEIHRFNKSQQVSYITLDVQWPQSI